jgi:hypothetical protein
MVVASYSGLGNWRGKQTRRGRQIRKVISASSTRAATAWDWLYRATCLTNRKLIDTEHLLQ